MLFKINKSQEDFYELWALKFSCKQKKSDVKAINLCGRKGTKAIVTIAHTIGHPQPSRSVGRKEGMVMSHFSGVDLTLKIKEIVALRIACFSKL